MSDLVELIAERDIARTLNRYARMLDTKDWSMIGEIFAEDISYVYGPNPGDMSNGIAPLLARFRRNLDVCGGTQHLLGSIVIEVDGDRATSSAYVQARHMGIGAMVGRHFDSNGEYADRWEKRAEGWRIVHRHATWAAHVGDIGVIGLH